VVIAMTIVGRAARIDGLDRVVGSGAFVVRLLRRTL
jgi:hypothetical protein